MAGKGILITFEGPEGCGKSTHIKLAEKFLKSIGMAVVLTREPGGTKLGKEIRKILLNTASNISSNAELFLFSADRAQHIKEIVASALESGKIVLSDRFIDSTIAYQIGGRGLPEDLVRYLISVSSEGIVPDLTFLLDIHPSLGIARAMSKLNTADRFESEKLPFHEKLREKYLEIAAQNPSRVKIINTEKPVDEAALEIKNILKDFIKK